MVYRYGKKSYYGWWEIKGKERGVGFFYSATKPLIKQNLHGSLIDRRPNAALVRKSDALPFDLAHLLLLLPPPTHTHTHVHVRAHTCTHTHEQGLKSTKLEVQGSFRVKNPFFQMTSKILLYKELFRIAKLDDLERKRSTLLWCYELTYHCPSVSDVKPNGRKAWY